MVIYPNIYYITNMEISKIATVSVAAIASSGIRPIENSVRPINEKGFIEANMVEVIKVNNDNTGTK